ncbi:hypothetical protein [Streptomyces avermitilis]
MLATAFLAVQHAAFPEPEPRSDNDPESSGPGKALTTTGSEATG